MEVVLGSFCQIGLEDKSTLMIEVMKFRLDQILQDQSITSYICEDGRWINEKKSFND